MSKDIKDLPLVRVRAGNEVFSGRYDKRTGLVTMEDGRTVLVGPGVPSEDSPEDTDTSGGETQDTDTDEEATLGNELSEPAGNNKAANKTQQKLQKRLEKQELTRKKKSFSKQKTRTKAEGKQTSRITGDAASYDPSREKSRKVAIAALYVVVITGLLFGAKFILNNQQAEVTVIRLKNDMLAGEVIREANLDSYQMLQKTYDELGMTSYKGENDTATIKQIIYKWEDKDDIVNKYFANYTQGGQYLTIKNVTDKKIIRNPWLAELDKDEEIYTLPLSTEGLNNRLLLPGTHLRARIVVQPKGEKGNSTFVASTSGSGFSAQGENELDRVAIINAGGVIPGATVVFDDLIAVDMLNATGESLFDIYMALTKLPIEERLKYLETTIEGNSTGFQQRVMPASLVLILNKEQATRMAEFENMSSAKIKYTILPFKDDSGNLLNSFTEIADQMNDIIEQSVRTEKATEKANE